MQLIEKTDNFMASLGVEAYRVGGSVRDELLGRRVADADYMVRGVSLGDLERLLDKAVQPFKDGAVSPLKLRDGRQGGWRATGKGLGLIEIMLPRTEVARDPKPGENVRHAFDIVVDPTITLAEDAKRRDFTFNALYKLVTDEGSVVADPTNRGLYDLQHKLVNTTHETSFRDDPLRTLRALRFVSVLGYDLSTAADEQMREYAPDVTGLSAKGFASGTVVKEMNKLLMGTDVAKALRLAASTGVLGNLFPELAPMIGYEQGSRYHDLTTDEHTFKALETAAKVDAPLRVRWALLFHDAGKPDSAWAGTDGRTHYYAPTGKEAKALRGPLDDETWEFVRPEDHEVVSERIWLATADRIGVERLDKYQIAALIRNHMVSLDKVKATKVRRERVRLGDDLYRDLLLHRMCDIAGKGGKKVNQDALARLVSMEMLRQEAQKAKVPATAKDLSINGHDVLKLGVEGRQVGVVLAAVLDEVVCRPDETTLSREWQLERASALRG